MAVVFPSIIPLRLTRLREPFDHPEWIYEIKHDGFRGLAYIENGAPRLVSRNGNAFRGFETLCSALGGAVESDAVLDGEIVCLGPDGRTLFNPLLYRRAEPYFYAFDCLWWNGRDLRGLALLERKEILRSIVPAQPCRLLYVDHVAGRGTELFRGACGMDFGGNRREVGRRPVWGRRLVGEDQEPGLQPGGGTAGAVRGDAVETGRAHPVVRASRLSAGSGRRRAYRHKWS